MYLSSRGRSSLPLRSLAVPPSLAPHARCPPSCCFTRTLLRSSDAPRVGLATLVSDRRKFLLFPNAAHLSRSSSQRGLSRGHARLALCTLSHLCCSRTLPAMTSAASLDSPTSIANEHLPVASSRLSQTASTGQNSPTSTDDQANSPSSPKAKKPLAFWMVFVALCFSVRADFARSCALRG